MLEASVKSELGGRRDKLPPPQEKELIAHSLPAALFQAAQNRLNHDLTKRLEEVVHPSPSKGFLSLSAYIETPGIQLWPGSDF